MSVNCEFKPEWIDNVRVNEWSTINYAKQFDDPPSKAFRKLESLLLLKAITTIDLAALSADDTISTISAVLNKALRPLPSDLVQNILNSIILTTEKVKIMKIEEFFRNIQIDKIDNQKYRLKLNEKSTINEQEFKDLTLEDFLELKELLRLLDFLECDVHNRLTEFLHLKNDLTVSGYEHRSKKTVRVAAICVYPAFVKYVHSNLKSKGLNCGKYQNKITTKSHPQVDTASEDFLPIAAVAAGFPSGLYDLESKKREILDAIKSGATEIDIVLSRHLVLGNRWQELYDEIKDLKQTCGEVEMKTILAVGECGSLENIYKASLVAIMAGSDYVKTSTGKETINATFITGVVMCRAIRNFYMKTGIKVGFKPAGGIRTADDALKWIKLILSVLGPEWLPLFRIGASTVVDNIVSRLKELHS